MLLCLLCLLVATGCAGEGAPAASPTPAPTAVAPTSPLPPSPTAGPSPSPTEQRCESPAGGYALSYPASWSTAAGEGIEPCTFFGPRPLELAPAGDASGVAVRVDVRDVAFDQALQDSVSEGEQTAEEREVDGRRAARVTGVLTEEVVLPAGTRTTGWLVEAGDRTITLHTDSAGDDDYEQAVQVLDAMAQSLEVR